MLEQVLRNIYVNEVSASMELLNKYGLDEFLGQFAEKVYSPDIHLTFGSTKSVGLIAGTMLTRINSTIGKIEGEEKNLVERIVADIAIAFLGHVATNSTLDRKALFEDVRESLETVSSVNGWNVNELMKRLKFDMLSGIAATTSDKNLLIPESKPTITYYDWLVRTPGRDKFIRDLKAEGYIKSEVEFRGLFNVYDEDFTVRIDKSRTEFLLLLIVTLVNQDEKWLGTKGSRGHFLPLKKCAVDFEENLLFKKDPKRIIENLKKKSEKYQMIKGEVERFLSRY